MQREHLGPCRRVPTSAPAISSDRDRRRCESDERHRVCSSTGQPRLANHDCNVGAPFFGLIHDENIAKLIGQASDAGKAGAWPVAYFQLYLQESGIPSGEGFAVGRILGALERAGLLMDCGWRADLVGWPMMGQLYIAQGSRSAQVTGNLWLSEALGFDLVIEVYKAFTVQVSGGEGRPSGSGLVVDRSHVITNRHVVTGLVGHDVNDTIEIRPSFKPPEAQ